MISQEHAMLNDSKLDDWQLLVQVGQAFRNLSDAFTDQVDMHRGQAILLYAVCGRDGMTQSEIAEQLNIQGATVTNMLKHLEEAGLVIRHRDPEDNRLVRVYATEKARQKERAISEQFRNMQAVIFKDLPDEERAALRRMLQQVLQNMSTQS